MREFLYNEKVFGDFHAPLETIKGGGYEITETSPLAALLEHCPKIVFHKKGIGVWGADYRDKALGAHGTGAIEMAGDVSHRPNWFRSERTDMPGSPACGGQCK